MGTRFSLNSAPGNRGGGEGAVWNCGNRGFSWSSAICTTEGLRLLLDMLHCDSNSTDYRVTGLQLRCLSHPQGVLLAASALIGNLYPTRRLG
ncbi:hypothetical protein [uncultured Rikenella sp.]|uniref:hypothetical protein n=1 Tax=uncultured Rikenella sp. TaxID=368003 RepID=UPI0025D1490D|nr:hypothetical protein [uncultured Rikenella sp.]